MSRVSQHSVKQLLTQNGVSKIIWDDELRGFGVRSTEAGAISFILDYRIRGRQRRYTIGRHPEFTASAARDEAMALRVDIQNGHDPLEERSRWRSEPTFSALADAWLAEASKRKRESSLYDDRRMLDRIVRPAIGERRLGEIKDRDIAQLHESLRKTPYQGNRVLALVTSIFNFGVTAKWIESSPARGIPKFPESKRERWLSVEEIQRFREALDAYHDQSAANALRLLLYTGSREGEVLNAAWEEFDLTRGVWTKPSHHTKQKKTEHVPLSADTQKLLASMLPENPTGPLFRGLSGKVARTTLRRPWIQACKAAGLVEVIPVKGKRRELKRYRPTVRIHDLRHSFASHLVSNGVSLQIVGKLLGHTQAGTTMRYAHLQDAALRDATNKLGALYAELPKKGKQRA